MYYVNSRQPADAASLEVGPVAPSFDAVTTRGTRFHSDSFRGRETTLLFVSPDCSSCDLTLEELEAINSKAKENLVVICRSGLDACITLERKHKLNSPALVDDGGQISSLFSVTANPTALIIDASGRIEKRGHPVRGEELEKMMQTFEPAV